jgi:hypothetical protein
MAGGREQRGTTATLAKPAGTSMQDWRKQLAGGIYEIADVFDLDPVDVGTAISYETAGTFNPRKKGPTTKWGQHEGLIQFGQPQQRQFGVDLSSHERALQSQLGKDGAIVKYLWKSGLRPGMSGMDLYSTINAGAPGKYGASDTAAGGAPGNVRDKWTKQMAGHRRKAASLLAKYGPGDLGERNVGTLDRNPNKILDAPAGRPGEIKDFGGKKYQFVETSGMAGDRGGKGWIPVAAMAKSITDAVDNIKPAAMIAGGSAAPTLAGNSGEDAMAEPSWWDRFLWGEAADPNYSKKDFKERMAIKPMSTPPPEGFKPGEDMPFLYNAIAGIPGAIGSAASDLGGMLKQGLVYGPLGNRGPLANAEQWMKDKFYETVLTPESNMDSTAAENAAKREDIFSVPEGEPAVAEGPGKTILDLSKIFDPSAPGAVNPAAVIDTGVPAQTIPDPFLSKPFQYPGAPQLDNPPDRPSYEMPDYSEYLAALEKLAPKPFDTEAYRKRMLWGNISEALADAAGGSGWSGAAGVLARGGGGFGRARAETERDIYSKEEGYEEDSRKFGLAKAEVNKDITEQKSALSNKNKDIAYGNAADDYEVANKNKVAQYDVTTRNLAEAHRVAQENAKTIYETELARKEIAQPKIVNTTKEGLVIQQTAPDGTIQFKVQKWGGEGAAQSEDELDLLKKRKEAYGEGSPEYMLSKYASLFAGKNPEAIKYEMAKDAVAGGYAAQIIPNIEEIIETIDDTMSVNGIMPGSDQYQEARDQMLATYIAQMIDLSSAEQMTKAASFGNMGAALILGRTK